MYINRASFVLYMHASSIDSVVWIYDWLARRGGEGTIFYDAIKPTSTANRRAYIVEHICSYIYLHNDGNNNIHHDDDEAKHS